MNTAQAKSIPSQYWGKKFVEKSSWTERVNGGTNGFSYSFLHLNVFFVLRQPKTILEEIQYLHGYGPCYSGKVHIRG